jgi:hypothetical protein
MPTFAGPHVDTEVRKVTFVFVQSSVFNEQFAVPKCRPPSNGSGRCPNLPGVSTRFFSPMRFFSLTRNTPYLQRFTSNRWCSCGPLGQPRWPSMADRNRRIRTLCHPGIGGRRCPFGFRRIRRHPRSNLLIARDSGLFCDQADRPSTRHQVAPKSTVMRNGVRSGASRSRARHARPRVARRSRDPTRGMAATTQPGP